MKTLFQDLQPGTRFRFRLHPNGLTFLLRDGLEGYILEIHDVVGSDIVANVAAIREITRMIDLVIEGITGLHLRFMTAEQEGGATLLEITSVIRRGVVIAWAPPKMVFDLVYEVVS